MGKTLVVATSAAVALWGCGGNTPSVPSQPSSASQPAAAPAPSPPLSCDASLWNHVHDPKRLQIVTACITATGTIRTVTPNDDGDIDIGLAPDPPFANLLNNDNLTKLSGNLQVEAICQVPVHPDVPNALVSCRNFTGTVRIPPVGTHVQATGTYLLDKDHGWMEIHPVTVIAVIP